MRIKLINFLKKHELLLNVVNFFLRIYWSFIGLFIKTNPKKIMFVSFGGRRFDDSPKSLYDQIINDPFFADYEFTWSFVKPSDFIVPRGNSIKIDTFCFFKELLKSKIWVSNTGIDRGIGIKKRGVIKIETWHGCPIKRICGEEASAKRKPKRKRFDSKTIRCAQSNYDLEIFSRVFNSDKKCFVVSDLPRNDELCRTKTRSEIDKIKKEVGIDLNDKRKIILYVPTYREYLQNKQMELYFAPPIDLGKWKKALGKDYILLFRAHYAVNKVLNVQNNDFVINVSDYHCLNDLYAISDCVISDYSSSFIDFSILERPMFCFAYDFEEYKEKRGLYLDLEKALPCAINKNEDDLLNNILTTDFNTASFEAKKFKEKFIVNPGHATIDVINKIKETISLEKNNKKAK